MACASVSERGKDPNPSNAPPGASTGMVGLPTTKALLWERRVEVRVLRFAGQG